ncbi:MAG: hypothetical protein OHK0039_48350 [Bacteroidia bacterium]
MTVPIFSHSIGEPTTLLHWLNLNKHRFMRYLTFLLLLSFGLPALRAQVTTPKRLEPDTTVAPPDETKGSLFSEWDTDPVQESLDGFQKNYHYPRPTSTAYDTILLNTRDFAAQEVPRYAPAVIQRRMNEIPAVIPLTYNDQVQRYIDVYTVTRRQQMSRMLGLSRVYFPIFEEHLDRMGLPMELKYLSVVESALDPHARSRVGATGLWQFMLATSRVYGLEVNTYVDERCDPLKATEAALRYLEQSYEEFGDWLLAIASYNCGPGNVRKAIARSGGKRDFWALQEYLPRETRSYVPAFIAATYAFNYASEHNLYPVYVDFDLNQDTLHLRNIDITLQEIAQMTSTDVELLRKLNPELKLDRIPYSSQPYVLRVPSSVGVYFAGHTREIYAQYGFKRDGALTPVTYAASYSRLPAATPRPVAAHTPPADKTVVYYTVRSGDVVGAIAEKYNVTPAQIADWNNLRRYRIRVGQKLTIYTSPAIARQAGARPAVAQPSQPSIPSYTGGGTIVNHTIRNGDTLWGIANAYNVKVEHILRLNRGLDAGNLKVGQTIRVK